MCESRTIEITFYIELLQDISLQFESKNRLDKRTYDHSKIQQQCRRRYNFDVGNVDPKRSYREEFLQLLKTGPQLLG